MNQLVIIESLARVGLKAVIAENGLEGVNLVKNRIEKGKKIFELIFMDIQMPVMDGFEAASEITKLNTGIPIIAMTANVMSGEDEIYKNCGMVDFLGKPFTSQELWRCLLKYIKPVRYQAENMFDSNDIDQEFIKSLKQHFLKNYRNKYNEIVKSLETGDVKLAHRLVHTLKSNAGQLSRTSLQKAAADVEMSLKDDKNLATEEQLKVLKIELSAFLDELSSIFNETEESSGSQETAKHEQEGIRELLEKLETLLNSGSPDCADYIEKLRKISDTELLIRQIDDYEFEAASFTLVKLMESKGFSRQKQ
jgi:CheY-like chemotaxis protein